jgi:hypothetical protein
MSAPTIRRRRYSMKFPAKPSSKSYLLHAIPAPLWRQVRAKARREGRSIRSLLLDYLEIWAVSDGTATGGAHGQ